MQECRAGKSKGKFPGVFGQKKKNKKKTKKKQLLHAIGQGKIQNRT